MLAVSKCSSLDVLGVCVPAWIDIASPVGARIILAICRILHATENSYWFARKDVKGRDITYPKAPFPTSRAIIVLQRADDLVSSVRNREGACERSPWRHIQQRPHLKLDLKRQPQIPVRMPLKQPSTSALVVISVAVQRIVCVAERTLCLDPLPQKVSNERGRGWSCDASRDERRQKGCT